MPGATKHGNSGAGHHPTFHSAPTRSTELVPLLHGDGAELLLVDPNTVFAIVDAAVGLGG